MQVLVFKDIKNNRWTLWSVDRKTHLGYRQELTLKDCELIVVEEKRQRVLKTKKRFPHAWIVGTLISSSKKLTKPVTYNPFKNKKFMANQKPITQASQIYFNRQGKVFKS